MFHWKKVSPTNSSSIGADADRDASNANANRRSGSNSNSSSNNGTFSFSSPTKNTILHTEYNNLGIKTAFDLLNPSLDDEYATSNDVIVTFCQAIDNLLGGGIVLGQVTEIAGMPGTGKTQLAIQLAVLARLIPDLGGVQGQTLYVDCDGSFLAERAWQMAKAVSDHARHQAYRKTRRQGRTSRRLSHNGANDTNNDQRLDDLVYRASLLTPEEILKSIQVYRVHDETALLATLFSLKDQVEDQWQRTNGNIPVRLIVVDSIAFHFRAVTPTNSQYYIQRTKTLIQLAAYLGDLASHYNLAVVAINQMTTKVIQQQGGSNPNNGSYLSTNVPALGESWAHATTTRLLLKNNEFFVSSTPQDDDDSKNKVAIKSGVYQPQLQQERTCILVKSPNRPPGSAAFQICHEGIRDVSRKDNNGTASHGVQSNCSQKRRRTM
jgi:RecA/RadA recombinase